MYLDRNIVKELQHQDGFLDLSKSTLSVAGVIPYCSKMIAKQDRVKKTSLIENHDTRCFDFFPRFTNHGLCLTKNGANLTKILKNSKNLANFEETFHPSNANYELEYISKDSSNHQFGFLIDGNRYKDLKRGVEWNKTSNILFEIAIHSSHDLPDVRGWASKRIVVQPGYATTIRIDLHNTTADDSIRSTHPEKRGCRFHYENEDLSAFKWYSKTNCLFDCTMVIAEQTCGCRPWDYPNPTDKTKRTGSPICDYYGNSCFNRVLTNKTNQKCESKCISNCEEIGYSISVDHEPLDPKGRICSYLRRPIDVVEMQTKRHVQNLFSERAWPYDSKFNFIPPKRRVMNILKDMLSHTNESYYPMKNEKEAFERDCRAKINEDLAAVTVIIDSPTFSRMKRNVKVTVSDKLALLGELIIHKP